MSLQKMVFVFTCAALIVFSGIARAETEADSPDGLFIGHNDYGLGLGNVKRVDGLRLNIVDRDVELVRGVNFTLWGLPLSANSNAEYTGLNLGLVGLTGSRFTGMTLSAGGVLAEDTVTGVTLGGLGFIYAKGEISGINGAFLGVYSDRDIIGVNLAGFGAIGSERRITGLNVAGLGVFAIEEITGLNAGLIIGSESDIAGFNIGVGSISESTIAGMTADFFTLADRYRGLDVSILNFTRDMAGLRVNGLCSYSETMRGLAAAFGVNIIQEEMKGLSIAAVNYAKDLQGVQIGLLNIVPSNPLPFRVLPFINARFK